MMKTIGLIGGMSWESTVTYYQVINETIKQQLGGLHSAKCILYIGADYICIMATFCSFSYFGNDRKRCPFNRI